MLRFLTSLLCHDDVEQCKSDACFSEGLFDRCCFDELAQKKEIKLWNKNINNIFASKLGNTFLLLQKGCSIFSFLDETDTNSENKKLPNISCFHVRHVSLFSCYLCQKTFSWKQVLDAVFSKNTFKRR